jgi:glycosyltransferase involved in cell wall biosynthesis
MENNKPIIVIDVDRLKYPYTGLFSFCYNLMIALSKYNTFDFIFYKHKKTKIPEFLKSISINIFDSIFLKPNKKISVWHTTSQLSKRIPRKGIHLVYTIHDLNFLYSKKANWKKERELLKIKKNIERSNYLTFISNFTKNEVAHYFDIKNKKQKVIYNGVNIMRFPGYDNPKIKPKKDFLFTIGVIDPKKNQHVILNLLIDNDYDLVISGIINDLNYFQFLKKEIQNYNLENRVYFTLGINEKDKYWYYSHCKAFIFPSISEGFGLPPIEAMNYGKPVFLSNLKSLPEIGGSVAYYFENFEQEHMKSIFEDGLKDYKEQNKKDSIVQWSNQFTWEKAAHEYTKIYDELLRE